MTLLEVRERQLRLLGAVVEHCEAHGLRYYLCAGTLLGAVRHQGYVPWDDDIDLMMPRRHFEALCASFPAAAPSGVSLRSAATSPGYVLPFAKVCDDRTRLEVESEIIHGLGVYIDVFPLDGWRRGRAGRAVQAFLLARLLDVMQVKHMTLERRRARGRTALLACLKALLWWLPVAAVARALDAVARAGAFESSKEGGVIVWGYQERVPVTAYGDPLPVLFEGRTYCGPRDPDMVLRTLYGDYLQLPPADQQVTNHRFVAYEI